MLLEDWTGLFVFPLPLNAFRTVDFKKAYAVLFLAIVIACKG
ncbi:hypothetical protein RRSWK_02554 [Rhodopirellula sp. SWK7]|nr:hypothetical protein RRSWK_02554 [Rhodopirellula sp. SWK7]